MRVADVLDLVRAPAALSVLGDALAGTVSANGRPGPRALALGAASVCLYTAGMALNDVADADLDADERPERPIPSGRIPRRTAFAIGAGLTAAGVGLAFVAGRRSGLVSLALAGSLWTYDFVAKPTKAGPIVMALCRGLDVMMGAAGPRWRRGLVPAATVAVHTAGLTVLSRGEVDGATPLMARTAVAASIASAAGVLVGSGPNAPAAVLGSTGYLGTILPAQAAAVQDPSAGSVRSATRSGVMAMIPLQAALVARAGSTSATAFLVGVGALSRVLARRRRAADIA